MQTSPRVVWPNASLGPLKGDRLCDLVTTPGRCTVDVASGRAGSRPSADVARE
jgi:hypothetical protein